MTKSELLNIDILEVLAKTKPCVLAEANHFYSTKYASATASEVEMFASLITEAYHQDFIDFWTLNLRRAIDSVSSGSGNLQIKTSTISKNINFLIRNDTFPFANFGVELEQAGPFLSVDHNLKKLFLLLNSRFKFFNQHVEENDSYRGHSKRRNILLYTAYLKMKTISKDRLGSLDFEGFLKQLKSNIHLVDHPTNSHISKLNSISRGPNKSQYELKENIEFFSTEYPQYDLLISPTNIIKDLEFLDGKIRSDEMESTTGFVFSSNPDYFIKSISAALNLKAY